MKDEGSRVSEDHGGFNVMSHMQDRLMNIHLHLISTELIIIIVTLLKPFAPSLSFYRV